MASDVKQQLSTVNNLLGGTERILFGTCKIVVSTTMPHTIRPTVHQHTTCAAHK